MDPAGASVPQDHSCLKSLASLRLEFTSRKLSHDTELPEWRNVCTTPHMVILANIFAKHNIPPRKPLLPRLLRKCCGAVRDVCITA